MKLIIALALAGACFGQGPTVTQNKDASQLPHYYTRQALVSTAGKITIQACSTCDQMVGEYIVINTSVACNVTFFKNGTAASTTAGTVAKVADIQDGGYSPPNVFTASNSTGGTAIGPIAALAAGAEKTFDISAWYLGNRWPTTKNYRVETDCSTGTTDMYIQFRKDLP